MVQLTLEPTAEWKERSIDGTPCDQDAKVQPQTRMKIERNLSTAFNY